MNDRIDLFKSIDFLQHLEEEVLIKISNLFREEKHLKGDVIFNENDIGAHFYVIKSGKVGLTKRIEVSGNNTRELTYFTAHEYFGELALIDDEPRSATAIAYEDSILLKIHRDNFLNTCKEQPQVLLTIVETMSRRLRETNDKYMNIWGEEIRKTKLAAVGTAARKIAHDIKSPLTVIVLTAQAIEKIFDGVSELTDNIIEQANSIEYIAKEIVDFASEKRIEPDYEDIDLEDFFVELTEGITPLLSVNEVDLNIEHNAKQRVRFDRIKITRVLTSLIKNAIESMDRKTGEITISSYIDNNNLILSVEDNGPGIPKQHLNNLFEPFISYNKKRGTGLGLSICKKIVETHEGKISVANSEKGGARFTISLPLK